MTWTGTVLCRITDTELMDLEVVCEGSDSCRAQRAHKPLYRIEMVNSDTGEVRRGLFCIPAAASVAYRLGMDFPPAPHVH